MSLSCDFHKVFFNLTFLHVKALRTLYLVQKFVAATPILYVYCQLMTMLSYTMHFSTVTIGDYENIFISSATFV